MRTGVGLALICAGAILAFAVTTNTSVLNLHTAGWVLMVVGLAGLVIPRRTYGWLGRRMVVRRTRPYTRGRVEEIAVTPYTTRDPGTTQMTSGLAQRPTMLNGDPVDGDTEVIEDVYEQ
jgi:hypothetical protein